MKLAVISSLCKPTTPDARGGQEVWTAHFISEEARRGKLIDLFAVAGSLSGRGIRLISVLPEGTDVLKDKFDKIDPAAHVASRIGTAAYARILSQVRAGGYDCIVDSSGHEIFPLNAAFLNIPMIIIGHFPVTKLHLELFKHVDLAQNVYYVFPSRYQYTHASWIPERAKRVIPHGIGLTQIAFGNSKRDSLVWVGRIDPTMPKGLDKAINVARELKKPLEIFGRIEDERFFEQVIKPAMARSMTVRNETNKQRIFARAKVLLMPIEWEEPFGLVLLEAMATGTPAIAFARGAAPEIIQDGVTGFLVHSSSKDRRGDWTIKQPGLPGLIEAVKRIDAMSDHHYQTMQRACRQRVETHFSLARMVDSYDKLLQTLTAGHPERR